jgi:hypothetical protein
MCVTWLSKPTILYLTKEIAVTSMLEGSWLGRMQERL